MAKGMMTFDIMQILLMFVYRYLKDDCVWASIWKESSPMHNQVFVSDEQTNGLEIWWCGFQQNVTFTMVWETERHHHHGVRS